MPGCAGHEPKVEIRKIEQAAALSGIDGKAGGPEQGRSFSGKRESVADAPESGFLVRVERRLPLRLLLPDALPQPGTVGAGLFRTRLRLPDAVKGGAIFLENGVPPSRPALRSA
jgi:hypothetical protein